MADLSTGWTVLQPSSCAWGRQGQPRRGWRGWRMCRWRRRTKSAEGGGGAPPPPPPARAAAAGRAPRRGSPSRWRDQCRPCHQQCAFISRELLFQQDKWSWMAPQGLSHDVEISFVMGRKKTAVNFSSLLPKVGSETRIRYEGWNQKLANHWLFDCLSYQNIIWRIANHVIWPMNIWQSNGQITSFSCTRTMLTDSKIIDSI